MSQLTGKYILMELIFVSMITSNILNSLVLCFKISSFYHFVLGENVSASLQYNTERVVESLVKSGFKERLQTLENGEETNLYREFSNDGVEISGGRSAKDCDSPCLI